MHRVHFRKEDVTLHLPDGANLRQACLDNGIDPHVFLKGKGPASCHGKGLCATCVVQVDEPDSLSEPTKRERRRFKLSFLPPLSSRLTLGEYRLSCQATVRGNLTVTTNPDKHDAWKTHTYYSGRPARSWKTSS